MPRRTSFLDLPREIRDQIYDYLLISPTGYITALYPIHNSNNSQSPSPSSKFIKKPPRSHLVVTACPAEYYHKGKPPISQDHYTLPSLSICRVNRQIYYETKGIFYRRNALFLPHPFSSTKTFPSAIRLLKVISQTSSRMIQKVVLCLRELGSSYKFFRKVLQALASRARHGDFKTLVLHIPLLTLHHFSAARLMSITGGGHDIVDQWEDMLTAFVEAGGKRCRYEREVELPDRFHDQYVAEFIGVAESINRALGGTLRWGNKIGYVDGDFVNPPDTLDLKDLTILYRSMNSSSDDVQNTNMPS